MKDRLKESFDKIHAEEELKNKTREFLAQKRTKGSGRSVWKPILSAVACLLFLVVIGTGSQMFFTPASVISIDINPSLELGINRFDRVISVTGYNEDGKAIAETLDVKYMNYRKALEKVLSNESFSEYLSRGGLLSVGVIDSDEMRSEQMLSEIRSCTNEQANVHCYSEKPEAVEEAHDHGLSYGKYRAFLELQAVDPSVTAEEIQGMTMKEIRKRIEDASSSSDSETPESNTGEGGHHKESGSGKGMHKGKGKNK